MENKKYLDNSGAVEYRKHAEPMTFVELRKRLKHIEILCCSLSIDLANEIQLREKTVNECAMLRAENDGLQKETQRLSSKLYHKDYDSELRKRKKGVKND
ncbi:MAG: hypothetical protein K2N33_00990 [Clostridia bacterium]|nr:hypothetical protein [Clostridia bacterium]